MGEVTLTATELTDLQGAMAAWNPDTCSIYRKTPITDDSYGGHGNTTGYTLQQAGVSCTIESSPKNDQERSFLGLVGDSQAFFITLPADTNVLIDDRLTITTRSNMNVRVMAVIGPESWELERKVLTTRLAA